MEFGSDDFATHALSLVDSYQHVLGGAPQLDANLQVMRRQALTSIDQKNHTVGLKDRLASLTRHLDRDPFASDRLEAAAVDHDEFALADPSAAVLPITRQPRHIGHQGRTRTREPVK